MRIKFVICILLIVVSNSFKAESLIFSSNYSKDLNHEELIEKGLLSKNILNKDLTKILYLTKKSSGFIKLNKSTDVLIGLFSLLSSTQITKRSMKYLSLNYSNNYKIYLKKIKTKPK